MSDLLTFFVLPSNLIILFSVAGIFLSLRRKFRKTGKYLLIIAAVIYLIFATGPVSFWLLGNLEYQYPYLQNSEEIKEVETIVILTAYAEADSKIPLSSRVSSSSAFRLLEAVRIFTLAPHSNIIITGYGDIPKIMKELLISMGLPANKILIENESDNTFESAKNIQPFVGKNTFALTTSAGHMPRSMKIFKKLEMNPMPAPTEFLTRKNYLAISYLPSPLHLRYSDLAVHEYIAIFWYRILGYI